MKTEIVTSLKRRATKIISSLEKHRDAVMITQRGRPAAYLVDVATYDAMRNKLVVLEKIARGEQAIEQGRVMSHKAAKQRLSRWLR